MNQILKFSLTPEPVVYRWTGETDLIMRGNDQELIVGSGGGSVILTCITSSEIATLRANNF